MEGATWPRTMVERWWLWRAAGTIAEVPLAGIKDASPVIAIFAGEIM